MFSTCQARFENSLAAELADAGFLPGESGPGWALASSDAASPDPAAADLAFPHVILPSPAEIRADSVNALAQKILEYFLPSLQGERLESSWPCRFGGADLVGLGRRISAVEAAFHESLRKRVSRVAKLASDQTPRGVTPARGLFVEFTDFGRVFVARDAFFNGPRRMADDDQAPSRSYLKIEEAYAVLGREPAAGETVVDLGAAPGGWSYSAAKRGARVLAVDNGPLKGGASGHPGIQTLHADAFAYAPAEGQRHDWLFCDLLEEPHHVMKNIVGPWLANGWCRHFVVNLKFGRVDSVALLRELRSAGSPLSQARQFRIRHLYHDREEFTVVGSL